MKTPPTPPLAAVDQPRLVRPHWFKGAPECDWPEDSDHENGNYFNKCVSCEADFIGHKRRHVCRRCHYEAKARYEAMTLEEREAHDAKAAKAIQDFWTNVKSNHQSPE